METKPLTKHARPTSKPYDRSSLLRMQVTSGCRRCGGECACSDEEIDAGGPA